MKAMKDGEGGGDGGGLKKMHLWKSYQHFLK